MNEFLKGNFKVKRPVAEESQADEKTAAELLKEKLRKKALSSLGGSMVYMERTDLAWDGEDEK